MLLTHNYWFFKNAIPVETCNKILKSCHKKTIKQATIFKGIDKTKRNCKIAWINDTWIYDIINPFIHTANKNAGWNFQWDWNESSQFTIYKKGEYYGWHHDQRSDIRKHTNKNLNGKTRKLSLTLQLKDKTEYEGGDFQFRWSDASKKDLLNITTVDDAKDKGTIIIFPSFIWHQISPITKGKRESLVNWSLGNPFM